MIKVSPNIFSRGLEAGLLPGAGQERAGPPTAGLRPKEGRRGSAAQSAPVEGPRPGEGAPGAADKPGSGRLARPPAEARGRDAACYLFLLLAEPRHLRGAQRRRGRGRGRGRSVGPGVGRGLHGGAPGPQRGERVLNKCLWRRRGRQLPSARVLALMHCAPRAEEAAPAFSAAPAAAARVRTARGRISHAHAARRRRRRRLGAAGRPVRAGGAVRWPGRTRRPVPAAPPL